MPTSSKAPAASRLTRGTRSIGLHVALLRMTVRPRPRTRVVLRGTAAEVPAQHRRCSNAQRRCWRRMYLSTSARGGAIRFPSLHRPSSTSGPSADHLPKSLPDRSNRTSASDVSSIAADGAVDLQLDCIYCLNEACSEHPSCRLGRDDMRGAGHRRRAALAAASRPAGSAWRSVWSPTAGAPSPGVERGSGSQLIGSLAGAG